MKIVNITNHKCRYCGKFHDYEIPDYLIKNNTETIQYHLYCPDKEYKHIPINLRYGDFFKSNNKQYSDYWFNKLLNNEPILGYKLKNPRHLKKLCTIIGVDHYELMKAQCEKLITNYKYRKDFEKEHPTHARFVYEYKLQDELYKNMMSIGSLKKRKIYLWLFPDNHFYVGLTCNTERRAKEHTNQNSEVSSNQMKSSVLNHINNTGLQPIYKELTDYVDVEKAKELEIYYEKEYRNKGYISLNRKKCGGIGASGGYTFEEVDEKAKLCSSRKEFKKNYGGYYQSAKDNGWYEKVTEHMVWLKKPNNHWTLENIMDEMKKYNSITEFRKYSRGAYDRLHRMGKTDIMHNYFYIK